MSRSTSTEAKEDASKERKSTSEGKFDGVAVWRLR